MREHQTTVVQWFLTTAVVLGVVLGAVAVLTLGGLGDLVLGAVLGAIIGLLLGGLVQLASRLGDGRGAGGRSAPRL
jgi:purine-cytosine permease-like protein